MRIFDNTPDGHAAFERVLNVLIVVSLIAIILLNAGCVQHDDYHTRLDMEAALKACAPASSAVFSKADHNDRIGRVEVVCEDNRTVIVPIAEDK